MHFVLFELPLPSGFPVEVTTYRALYILATFLAIFVAWFVARKNDFLSKRAFIALAFIAFLLPIGARL